MLGPACCRQNFGGKQNFNTQNINYHRVLNKNLP